MTMIFGWEDDEHRHRRSMPPWLRALRAIGASVAVVAAALAAGPIITTALIVCEWQRVRPA